MPIIGTVTRIVESIPTAARSTVTKKSEASARKVIRRV